jgi:hypothetical protein
VADTTQNESITEAVPTVLGKYLVDEVNSLREYYPEFPAPNMTLEMPSVSIFAPSPEFRPLTPYLKKPVDPAEIVNHKAPVQWVVGIYDFNLQLDLWARSKEERDDMFDQLFNALNPDIQPMGLRLQMEEYFGQLCEYVYNGHEVSDSEERSQRDEWRLTLNVLATCKAIRTRKEFISTDVDTAADIEESGEISTTFKV